MNIKTITCHNVYNYGATLQEYALLKYIESLGHEVETVNYRPDYLSYHFNFFSIENSKFQSNIFLKTFYIILKLPIKLRLLPRKVMFDRFSKKYIKETKRIYKTNDELLKFPPTADVYIAGSDQIWNTSFKNGHDLSFYLNFANPQSKKISYAASFALESILDKDKMFVKENIKNFNSISVRETSAQKILKSININNSIHVLDPVFLLDIEEWNKFVTKPVSNKNYILIYDFDNNHLLKKVAIALKNKFDYQIITLNKNIQYADKNFHQCGPEVFLNLIKNAQIVLSNSFHALAFSIIFQKNFLIFGRNQQLNTRMMDLLENLELKQFYIVEEKDFNIENITINYTNISPILKDYVLKSKEFLNKELII